MWYDQKACQSLANGLPPQRIIPFITERGATGVVLTRLPILCCHCSKFTLTQVVAPYRPLSSLLLMLQEPLHQLQPAGTRGLGLDPCTPCSQNLESSAGALLPRLGTRLQLPCLLGLPGDPVVKNLPASAGDVHLIPGLGISPGEGNGTPLQCSGLGNRMDRGAQQATLHGVTKESDTTQ